MASSDARGASRLKQSGGGSVPITKEVIFERLETYFPDWKNKTIVVPIIPDLKYEGPIGFPGVLPKIEETHKGLVKGQNNEAKVLKVFETFSRSHKKALKIFHDLHSNKTKMKALRNAFGFDSSSAEDFDLEIDVLAVGKVSICLVEVKSSISYASKAIKQLERAEAFTRILLRLTCLENLSIPIRKMFCVPGPFDKNTTENANANRVTLLDLNSLDGSSTMSEIWNQKEGQTELILNDFIAALAFLRCCLTLNTVGSSNDQLENALLEGAKGLAITKHLYQQKPLKSWKNDDVQEVIVKDDLSVWLDPTQDKILFSKHPNQVIIGPASTGKTILVQLKVMGILGTETDSNVLIVLPTEKLQAKYEKYFQEANVNPERLTIMTAHQNFQDVVIQKDPHIFMDEFCASVDTSQDFFMNQVHSLFKRSSNGTEQKSFWITADFKQGLESPLEMATTKKMAILEQPGFIKSYLKMQHRCTLNVLKSYSKHCGPLTKGDSHQHKGEPTKIINVKPNKGEELIDSWVRTVDEALKTEENNACSSKNIAVVIPGNDSEEVTLYLKFKSKYPEINIFFEFETLSQEWPVIIACISKEDYLDSGYVTFSRAIYKLIIVIGPEFPTDNRVDEENDARMTLLGMLKPNHANNYRPRPPQIEMIGFHQLIHETTATKILENLRAHINEIVQKLNYWLKQFDSLHGEYLEQVEQKIL
jgi:hypothetical protein